MISAHEGLASGVVRCAFNVARGEHTLNAGRNSLNVSIKAPARSSVMRLGVLSIVFNQEP